MKLSNLINKVHQTFARVLFEVNLFDSLFPHHATKLKQNHRVNLKSGEQIQRKKSARPVQFDVLELGAMECWHTGPSFIDSLRHSGYTGWLVIEQDTTPDDPTTLSDKNRRYLEPLIK